MGLVFFRGDADGLLHVGSGGGKAVGACGELCAVGVAVGRVGELADERLEQLGVSQGVERCRGHIEREVGLVDVIREGYADMRGAEGGIVDAQAVDGE